MNITSLILSSDFQKYVTHGYDARLCYVDVCKLNYNIYVQGCNQEIFMAWEVLVKKVHNICKVL